MNVRGRIRWDEKGKMQVDVVTDGEVTPEHISIAYVDNRSRRRARLVGDLSEGVYQGSYNFDDSGNPWAPDDDCTFELRRGGRCCFKLSSQP